MNFGKIALLALAGASMAFFASCGKDEKQKAAPTILVKNKDIKDLGPKALETDFPLNIFVRPTEGLKVSSVSYTVSYKNKEGQAATTPKKDITVKKGPQGYTGQIELKGLPEGIKEGTITIVAVDSEKSEAKAEIVYNFNPAPNPPQPTPESGWGETKEGWLNHKAGNKEGAFNLKTCTAVSITSGEANDRYMMNTSKGENGKFEASFTSEKVSITANGQNKDYMGNKTVFKKVENKEFDKITVKDAEEMIKNVDTKTVEKAQVNDIFIAKHGDELYLLKVTKIDMNSLRLNTGHMVFSYKAKK